MKKFLVALSIILAGAVIAESLYIFNSFRPFTSLITPLPAPKPLLVYSFENLKKTRFPMSNITLGGKTGEAPDSFSQMFYYQTPVKPGSTTMQAVSGLMNLPSKPGNYPVIVMFRGFVPSNIYAPGVGTEPVARVLADNGFITLAPDFLGFGQSSPGAKDSFENRFQSYTTALSLLSSLQTLNAGLDASYSGSITADMQHIGIWGHSNGGHIALSALAISGVTYPTVLWAPVSTSFPYDIVYYTDESDDQGKVLRKILAQFESVYNTDLFSPTNYYQWIKAPMQINQGTADQEVPYWWSESLVATLKKDKVDVTYNTYPGADHNMLPSSSWNAAVANTVMFFQKQFGK